MEKKISITERSPALQTICGTSTDCYKYGLKIVLLILLFVVACEREVVVPQDLIGKWKTSAPRYADRYIKFSEHTVVYGVGNDEEVSHTIDKIDIKRGDTDTVYTFHYRDAEGEKAIITFSHRPDSGGTLQLKNSKNIWKKDTSGDAG